jgi:acetyl esterase/lipase
MNHRRPDRRRTLYLLSVSSAAWLTGRASASTAIAPHRISYGAERLQFGDLYLPVGPGPHPVALTIHGGFWRAQYGLDHIAGLSAALSSAGVAVWNIEYRRLGDPGGGWPGTFTDVGQAADHIRELARLYQLDLKRAAAVGHSAGGHLALWLAGRHWIACASPLYTAQPIELSLVVALAPVADLKRAYQLNLSNGVVQQFLGAPEEHTDRYRAASPAEMLPLRVRQTLVHGTQDHIVPIEISRSYREAAVKAGDQVELIEHDGAGHFEVVDPQTVEGQKVIETVAQALSH